MRSLFLSLCLLASGLVLAQQDLTVEVIDYQSNQPAVNVAVVLVNASRGFSQSQLTNEQGRAVFRLLPAVEGYRVQIAETDQYLETQSELIDIRSKQNRTVQIVLLTKRTVDLEEVNITASATTDINRNDAEVSFELRREEIEAIPVEGRDITRVLYRLPNVSRATGFFPEAPNVAINGANSLFTSYLIDGLDNNERFLGGQKFAIPTGFTKNVTVLTNNYSAEYGLTSNGVINITTRSGSNDFGGEAYFITRPGPDFIDAETRFDLRDLSGNFVGDGFQRYQAGAAFGGAIKKDKTFYYFDFEHTTDLKDNQLLSAPLGISETIEGNNYFTYLSGKVDHLWSNRFRSSLRANVGFVEIERQGGGLEGGVAFPSAGNIQDRNSILVASNNTYVSANSRFSSQTNFQYARFLWDYAQPRNPNSPLVTVLDPTEQTAAVLGHPGFIFRSEENTFQVQQKFSFYLGKHTLKTGVNFITSDHRLNGGGVPNGSYRVKLTQGQLDQLREQNLGADLAITDIPSDVEVLDYNVELRPNSFGTRQTIYSIYIEDQLAVNERLNLTLGLRYDYDNLSEGGSDEGDYNNIAPRFNFNYKLNSRSVIRGGYGIFYDKILYAVYSDALQQNTDDPDYRRQIQSFIDQGLLPADTDIDQVVFNGNLTASVNGVSYLNGPTADDLQDRRSGVFSSERRILNPNGYDNPFTHQFALGYQLQLDERSLFFVDLVHNRSENLFRLRNLNAAAPYPITDPDNVVVRTPEEADLTRPVPIIDGSYGLINGERVDGVARNVVISETAGKSRYYAASFNLQRDRGATDFSWRVNYTLSLLENDTEDINFRAMDANNFEDEFGPSINDRRHIINAIGSYHAPFGLTVTLAGLFQSGQPINRIPDATIYGTADLNGDGASFGDAYVGNSDRYPGESRNSDRLPWSETIDASLQYQFPLGQNALELRADIFNVLNTTNLSGFSNNATSSNQIQAGPAGSGIVRRNADAPRQFQFGLRFLF